MSTRLAVMAVYLATALGACSDNLIIGPNPIDEMDENQRLGLITDGIRVMTRNVYVGTDVDRVLAANSPDEIPLLAAEAFQGLLATDFRERARLIAREIAWTNPHLIGLQEISTIRVQSPGDVIVGGTETAQTVLLDYLEILLQAIEEEGLSYRTVAFVQNADVEVPMLTSSDPLTFDDVRLTDYDVILARQDVPATDPLSENYAARLSVPSGAGLTIDIPRGVVAVTTNVQGQRYRFVNTHLEPASIPEILPLQLAQAQELLALLEGETDPIILVGDLNTHAPTGETYQLLMAEGFADVWLEQRDSPEVRFTCCHSLDLLNPSPALDRRIDLVLYRGQKVLQDVQAVVVGDEMPNRTTEGVWPSDHAGVVANLRF